MRASLTPHQLQTPQDLVTVCERTKLTREKLRKINLLLKYAPILCFQIGCCSQSSIGNTFISSKGYSYVRDGGQVSPSQLQTHFVCNGWTDEFRFCCLARGVGHCHPPPDEFSSCEDLMSNIMLRVSVWVLGTLALSGNFIVIVWRIYESDNKVHSFLITNLALGDLCMGFYLIIIAAVDVNYRGVYFIYDAIWRSSSLCQLAGFFSTFSSELSVFTLTVITLERFSVIIFPFRTTRLNMQWTKIIMGVVWASVGVLAALPLADIHYFRYTCKARRDRKQGFEHKPLAAVVRLDPFRNILINPNLQRKTPG
ncbi:G-protein coupled receptor GRL101-like [Penaeus monodon]|uniref:G-protein coupled receptor GRL101-like n=1 Tax=Penaeus monodon TaxID=6687 RepID=UPI0018A74AC4|nr:G-protein coupled receptor GRL101-like [Penaeus monodon]